MLVVGALVVDAGESPTALKLWNALLHTKHTATPG